MFIKMRIALKQRKFNAIMERKGLTLVAQKLQKEIASLENKSK
jgi:hypothetical protein